MNEEEVKEQTLDVPAVLRKVKEQIADLKEKHPEWKVYLSVTPEFNEAVTNFLSDPDYSIRLSELYGADYRVSPFLSEDMWYIVSWFDYSMILWQWNTFNDMKMTVKELDTTFIWYKN